MACAYLRSTSLAAFVGRRFAGFANEYATRSTAPRRISPSQQHRTAGRAGAAGKGAMTTGRLGMGWLLLQGANQNADTIYQPGRFQGANLTLPIHALRRGQRATREPF